MEHEYHRELKQAVVRMMRLNAWEAVTEFPLPNNKIADVIGMHADRRIIIVEVKTTLRNTSVPAVFNKYSLYCDGLYIAADLNEVQTMNSPSQLLDWRPMHEPVGYLGFFGGGIVMVKQAKTRMMDYERRHTLSEAIAKRLRHSADCRNVIGFGRQ
jgi:hypothetical protein